MKNLFLLLLLLTGGVWAKAQKVYYVFFESEKNLPFYVKSGDKLFSGDNGYITISGLDDSTYNFKVGLVGNEPRETTFPIKLSGEDRGFLVNNTDAGLALKDLSTKKTIRPDADPNAGLVTYQHRNDNFTALLAKASNDTSLFWVPVYAKETETAKKNETKEQETLKAEEKNTASAKTGPAVPKEDTPAQAPPKTDTQATAFKSPEPPENPEHAASGNAAISKSKDTVSTTTAQTGAEPKKIPEENKPVAEKDRSTTATTTKAAAQTTDNEPPPPPAPEFKRSKVSKHAESSTSEGFGLVYYDNVDGTIDTIRLVIPNPRFAFKDQEASSAQDNKQFLNFSDKKETEATPVKEPQKEESAKQHESTRSPEHPSTKETSPRASDSSATTTAKKEAPAKHAAACTSVASENDFLKVRKNMASKYDNEEMIAEAKKFFKTKCFSTEQIRYLSTLFLTAEGKYRFFDAAFSHVTDPAQFLTLGSEIKDDYYQKRFKALVGE